jgi:hypothetical protein
VNIKKLPVLLIASLCAAHPACADDALTLSLIELLVQEGVIDQKKAGKLMAIAEQRAAEKSRSEPEARKPAEVTATQGQEAPEPGDVRVTYVPDFVKEEIRRDVRRELRDEVVKEVKSHARSEQWGVPAALPDWVNRFRLSGDLRLRYENDLFASENPRFGYPDWPAINKAGGWSRLVDPYRNTSHDRDRYRMRLRLALDAQIAEYLRAGVRLTTSNDRSPIANNQTLGQYGKQYEVALDRAFLQYDYVDGKGRELANLWGGRFANPWLSSDNVYDVDLSFEGVAAAFHLPLGSTPAYRLPNPQGRQTINLGVSKPNQLFLTVGAFPLQDVELSAHDKWFWGAQTGLDWVFRDNVRLRAGLAYYDYRNIKARPNALGERTNDWSAPTFFAKGNSLARISNEQDPDLEPRLVGLASDFNVADAIVTLDWQAWGENHVMLTGNYARNLGFDRQEILRRTGLDIVPRTDAYQVRIDVGRPEINQRADWNLWWAYKYLERDSVLDAFTDSNFHLGGTDAKGWSLGFNYGLAQNTWFNARWMSASAINGPPLDIDVLLVDVNSRF